MRQVEWPKVAEFLVWNKIKVLRKTLNLTCLEVASGVGAAQGTISLCERGYEDMVSKDTKHRIADYFDVAYDDLFPAERMGSKPAPSPIKKAPGPIKVQIQEFREK